MYYRSIGNPRSHQSRNLSLHPEYLQAHPIIKDVTYFNVIAQEFREVFPDAVKGSGEKLSSGEEILQVDTYPATITALAAIKELKAMYEKELHTLSKENVALTRRVAALERTNRFTTDTESNHRPSVQKVAARK
jgi:hypothetical protein